MATLSARLFPMLSQLLRGRGREAGPIVLDRRRIYILPTRHGMLFGVFLLAMLVGSINYALSLGYVLTFLLGAVSMVAILHTYRNLQGLKISQEGTSPAFAGDDAHFQFEFTAPEPRFALCLQWQNAMPVRFDLDTAGAQRISVAVPTEHRGLLQPGRFKLYTVYPLGLFHAWSYLQFSNAATVYPRPADARLTLPASGDTGRQSAPNAREGSDDFAGLRAWQPGDSPRQVAWKVAARSDELATKRFSDTQGGVVVLDWDDLHGMETEERLSRLCRWVLDAEQANLRYGLRLPGVNIAPDNGAPHRHHCLEALALFGLTDND